MKNAVKWSSLALAVAAGNGLLATQAMAEGEGFVEGASATLYNRTVYFNRDFRDNVGQSKREETATSFLLNFESGYTKGPIGFGADVMAQEGIKLDSGRGRSGTGLLPVDSNGRAEAEYMEIRGAVKMAILDDTVIRYGFHMPENPVAAYDDSRLLPNHYQGYSITNSSIDGLFVEAGRLTDRGEMADSSETDGIHGDDKDLTYAGGTYTFTDNFSATLYGADSEDQYERVFAGFDWTVPLSEGTSLNTNVAYYDTSDDDSADGTEFDNQAASIAVTLNTGYHGFGLAYQQMSGDGRYLYDDGEIFIANSVQYADFNAVDEKSYQARYDYDFAGLGIPGLSFMTRYIAGTDINTNAPQHAGVNRDSRWERDSEVRYTVQAGPLEGVNFRWRNATVRQDAALDGGDVDENRLIVGYTWTLL
ncbi:MULTISPECIES: OprD family porin [Pseudomonas]|jgi:imipenem/basic amino acid-specific outer membrane pore|uniref:Outer membrane porin, OprD family n=1 Tax=Pseudomonas abyssi TaxID=170540 RepID=A0A2A3MD41_9PSED|nr:OprD family porin [Pseudomonas abyssi]MAC99479.1 porin [Pseudomonadales bacterium]PBK02682.1 outer membrane porin, OprD family [Pseudomonas abyssi]|tara:strand:+ start:10808 stop:12067 length:1260 start_codon:yes stop_codon:yes gene_type:complete